jgi:hypothetical protein
MRKTSLIRNRSSHKEPKNTKRTELFWCLCALSWLLFLTAGVAGQSSSGSDRRLTDVRTTNSTVNLRTYSSKDEWLARADQLRHQILVSAGLWPEPPKPDLGAHIFGLTDHGTYTIEKVYFESVPGFFVTGNLYRPKNKSGKVPGVLFPHGHWNDGGRLDSTPAHLGPRPAISSATFACFDMVKYNDSTARQPSLRWTARGPSGALATWSSALNVIRLGRFGFCMSIQRIVVPASPAVERKRFPPRPRR